MNHNNSGFWVVVAEDDRRRARNRRDQRDRRAGHKPAPHHPVLDFLLGVLVIMVIVALVVH